jgi:hypothetical protein
MQGTSAITWFSYFILSSPSIYEHMYMHTMGTALLQKLLFLQANDL